MLAKRLSEYNTTGLARLEKCDRRWIQIDWLVSESGVGEPAQRSPAFHFPLLDFSLGPAQSAFLNSLSSSAILPKVHEAELKAPK